MLIFNLTKNNLKIGGDPSQLTGQFKPLLIQVTFVNAALTKARGGGRGRGGTAERGEIASIF